MSSMLRDGREHLLVALESYFDMSGGFKNVPYVVVVGAAAEDFVWAEFDKKWRNVLDSHPLKPSYLHMREAAHLEGEFSGHKGWTDTKVLALVNQMLGLLSALDKKRIKIFFCAIDMSFRRVVEGKDSTAYRTLCRG